MIKRAVITGATGAIGTALIETLLQSGASVLVLARGEGRLHRLPTDKRVTVRILDLAEIRELDTACEEKYDVFYHLAWAGTAGTARNDAALQARNIGYAIDAVELAARLGCHTFIGAGSQAEYGRYQHPLSPDTPTFPETGYGAAKLCAGQLTRIAARACALRHIWVRVCSVYGPRDGESSMISRTARALLAGQTPRLTAGEQMWDYLYSKDAARAFYLLAERGRQDAIYTLGSGVARPLKEYVMALRDCISPTAPLDFGALPYAPDQLMHLCADISALTRDTGWQPTTPFAVGIAETVRTLQKKFF